MEVCPVSGTLNQTPGPFLLETDNVAQVKHLNFMIQFMSLKNKILPPLKFLREFIKMPSNQNFFLEPKLVIISKSDKISFKRQLPSTKSVAVVFLYT